MNAREICTQVQKVEHTKSYIPLMGYIVLYDHNMFTFGKILYVEGLYPFTNLLTKFFVQFCTNHNISLTKKFHFPTRKIQIAVYERHNAATEAVEAMIVRNLSKRKLLKHKLKGLSKWIPKFNETTEEYEQLYKEIKAMKKEQRIAKRLAGRK